MATTVGVLSACSGDKEPSAIIDCSEIDASTREELICEYGDYVKPAASLYTGDEHTNTKVAVQNLREIVDVEWRIISAGFGLVEPTTRLPSYECTFKEDQSVRARLERRNIDPSNYTIAGRLARLGRELGIPTDLKNWFRDDLDILFVLLSSDYLKATTGVLDEIPSATRAYAFAPEGSRDEIGRCDWVPSTETERDALNTLWTRLKGHQFRNLATSVNRSEELLSLRDVEELRNRSLGRHS